MSFFNAFAASFGAMLLFTALVAAWLFRTSSAPVVAKIAIPVLIFILACATPFQVNQMLGFPFTVLKTGLPQHAELVAFVANDDDKTVDIWLRQPPSPPRAYETVLDDKLKNTLREAQARLGHGGRVMLVKAKFGKRTGHDAPDDAPSDPGYELDDSMFSKPPK